MLLRTVGLIVGFLAAQAFAGVTPSQSSEGSPALSVQKAERARESVYVAKVIGKRPLNYRITIYRSVRKVNVYVLGFCGEFWSGSTRIRNGKFRKSVTGSNGFGIYATGRFSRKANRIKGEVRVWGPTKKKCDSGKRKYVATKV